MPKQEGDGLLPAAAPAKSVLRAMGGQQPAAVRAGMGTGPSPPLPPGSSPAAGARHVLLSPHRSGSCLPPQMRSALQEQERSIAFRTEVRGLLHRGILTASELETEIMNDDPLFTVGVWAAVAALPGGWG